MDAFADRPFAGNPAAVCVLPSNAQMSDSVRYGNLCGTLQHQRPPHRQAIAAEMNLSETAFVEPTDDPLRKLLRWFTPTMEVPLCGHATLAAAAALSLHHGWSLTHVVGLSIVINKPCVQHVLHS